LNLIFRILSVSVILITGIAQAQFVPVVPDKISFADMNLIIEEGAKPALSSYVSKLTSNPRFFRQMVDRADAYLPIVERIFQEEGLPVDFRYSVIQESSLVSHLVSSSNAVGYWQFKKETATEMGLRVDEDIDERMNIVSSSRSAARYLNRHNQYMQNWVYSLLAYYAGLSGAKALIDPSKIGAKTMEINENTHWYILKFLAHKIAFEPHLYRNTSTPGLRVLEFTDCENKSLDQLSRETNYPVEQLQFYNRWILKGFVPADKDYVVILPLKPEDGVLFEGSPLYVKASPPVEKLEPWRERYFFGLIEKPVTQPEPVMLSNGKVEIPVFFSWNGIKAIQAKEGDSPARLALLAGIGRDEFLEYNDLRVFDPLVKGEVYYVDNKKNRAKVPYHTVQPGESLWEVAQKYGIRLKSLMAKNRMPRPEKLKKGRVLWLRHTRPEEEPVRYEAVPDIDTNPQPVRNTAELAARPAAEIKDSPVAAASPQVDLKKIEQDARQILGKDTLVGDHQDNTQELPVSQEIEIETVSEKINAASPAPETPELVLTASTRVIPAETPQSEQVQKETPAPLPVPQNGRIEVAQGMTWYKISRHYKKPLDSLLAWNSGLASELKVGQTISVENVAPEARPAGEQPVKAISEGWTDYEIKPGDTAYKIARQFSIRVDDLLKLNQREDAVFRAGEIIKVPR
jgi:membrane-bound lytic murein transglycosylase D